MERDRVYNDPIRDLLKQLNDKNKKKGATKQIKRRFFGLDDKD